MTNKIRNTDWLETLDELIAEETNKLLAEGHDEEKVTDAAEIAAFKQGASSVGSLLSTGWRPSGMLLKR